MANQNDIAALYTSSPALLTTAMVILVVIAFILVSWGACLYGIISSCAAQRRRRTDEEEMQTRRGQADEFVLSVIGRKGLNLETRSVRSETSSVHSTERTLVPAGPVVMDLRTIEEIRGAEVASSRRKTELYDSMV